MSQKLDIVLEAAIESTRETAVESLFCEDFSVVDHPDPTVGSSFGAYVPMTNNDRSFYLGLVSSEEACRDLAYALMGFGPEEEELEKADMVDAFGEIVNIIAGILQRKLVEKMSRLKLGLPMIVDGRISGRYDSTQAAIRIDGVPVDILLLTKPRRRA